MKVYRIKTNDFAKLTNNKNLLTSEQSQALEKYQSLIGDKIVKFMPRGKDIVLCITAGGDYFITCKPVYVDSLVKILESLKDDDGNQIIPQDKIKILNKPSTQNDLSIEQIKNLLIA